MADWALQADRRATLSKDPRGFIADSSHRPEGFEPEDILDDDTDLDPEVERQKGERATVLYRRSVERKRRRTVTAVLLATTLFIALLNGYKIHRMRAFSPGLAIQARSALQGAVDYIIDVEWSAQPIDAEVLPSFRLDGRELPGAISVRPTKGSSESYALSIEVHPGTSSGDYEGTLVFRPSNGSASLEASRFDINIHVPSPLEEWSLLASWFVLLLVIVILLNAFNLYWYPSPHGIIEFRYNVDGRGSRAGDMISLSSRWSWLRATSRSVVDLTKIIESRHWAAALGGLPEITVEFERIALSYGVKVELDIGSSVQSVLICYSDPGVGEPLETRAAPIRTQLARKTKPEWYLVTTGDDWLAFRVNLSNVV